MQLKTTLATEFATMTTGAGYNNTYTGFITRGLLHPNDIKASVNLCFWLNETEISIFDDKRETTHNTVDLGIQVTKKTDKKGDADYSNADDEIELIVGDLKMILSSLMTKYINDSTSAWNIMLSKAPLKISRFILTGDDVNKVIVRAECPILFRRHRGILG